MIMAKCPYCNAILDDRAHTYGECINTDSITNLNEIYEDYQCKCKECCKTFVVREIFTFVKCEVINLNQQL